MGKASRTKKLRRQGGGAVATRRVAKRLPVGQMEARVVVGGKTRDGEPDSAGVGLVLDPDTDEVIGAIPGTPAAEDIHGVAESMGYKVNTAKLARHQGRIHGFSVPDENGDVHMEPLALPKGFAISTVTLAQLSALARKQPWCTKALDEILIGRLDPKGRHLVVAAFRHTTQDWKRDNVRCRILLKRRDLVEPETRMIDLPSHQFGILLSTQLRFDGKARSAAERLLPGAFDILEQPTWAAGRSFPKVWEECAFRYKLAGMLQVYGDALAHEMYSTGSTDADTAERTARAAATAQTMLSAATLNVLSAARLIVAEPEWVQGIDDDRPDINTLWAYAERVPLPFDSIYLDFEGPGGMHPTVPIQVTSDDGSRVVRETSVRLAGCAMWREGDELHVVPIGWPSEWGLVSTSTELGEPNRYQPLGKLVVNTTVPPMVGGVGVASIAVDGLTTSIQTSVVSAHHAANTGAAEKQQRLEAEGGRIETAYVSNPAVATSLAQIVLAGALRSLRVLYMLQGSNVELVEAKLHREGKRRARRAEKRGRLVEIGLMVAVRWKKRLYFRPPDVEASDNEGAGYSHAFWVTGHPKYYPLGTRIADALAEAAPEKLIDHPDKGLCRMVWTPPFIKGLRDPDSGEEREPVDKVRKVVGDPYEDVA
jgi:hypothetical protein